MTGEEDDESNADLAAWCARRIEEVQGERPREGQCEYLPGEQVLRQQEAQVPPHGCDSRSDIPATR